MRVRSRCAAERLCSWIERHLDSFRLPSKARVPHVHEVKPFSELVLILFALTAPRHRNAGSPFAAWAEEIAECLWGDAESLGAQYAWNEIQGRHSCDELVLLFPVLNLVLNRSSAYDETVAQILISGADGLKPDFSRDVAGLGDCRPAAEAALAAELAEWDRHPASSSLYNATHAVFFATMFGRRDIRWPQEERVRMCESFGQFALDRLSRFHFDIAAELLIAMAWIEEGVRPAFHEGIAILGEAAEKEGSIPTDPRDLFSEEFNSRYHATIVTLAALAEASIRGNSD